MLPTTNVHRGERYPRGAVVVLHVPEDGAAPRFWAIYPTGTRNDVAQDNWSPARSRATRWKNCDVSFPIALMFGARDPVRAE